MRQAVINKTAMVTISGRPNVGKSTLVNALVGEKVAIVTNKPQTTRNRILAVLNRAETQFIFVDTPGYHAPRTRLGDYMVKVVRESIVGVDAVILMAEPIPSIGKQEEGLIHWMKSGSAPGILVINKIDTVKKEELLKVIDLYQTAHNFDAILPISARKREGLDELIDLLGKYALEGPQLFPDDMITDQPERQIMAEILREKLLLYLQKEIPHGTAVEIETFSQRENGIIDIEATIYTEKASHKGMIIGKNGAMLRQIGEMARKDMERFMGEQVFLTTWVKVKEKWRDSDYLIRNFGYTSQ